MSNQKPLKIATLDLLNAENDIKPEEVTRLYKDQNHKVKKALAFKTNTDKPKLA